MASIETSYFIKNGMLWRHQETDRDDEWAFMRKGANPVDTPLCSVAEARTRYPDQLRYAIEDQAS